MARFIGGSHDGAEYRVEVGRGARSVMLPTADRGSVLEGLSLSSREACGGTYVEEYRRERIAGTSQKFEVYVHSSVDPDMMLFKLIDQYRSIPSERQIDEREKFETMIHNRKLPIGRHVNSDGSLGIYKLVAVQLAWEAWLESAGYAVSVKSVH